MQIKSKNPSEKDPKTSLKKGSNNNSGKYFNFKLLEFNN